MKQNFEKTEKKAKNKEELKRRKQKIERNKRYKSKKVMKEW